MVLGCARSGTKYISAVFRKVGLKVGHEFVDDHGTATHFFAEGTSGYPFFSWEDISRPMHLRRKAHRFDKRSETEFEYVWHQVREPLKVIGSCALIIPENEWQWLEHHCPQIRAGIQSREHKSMLYWYHWNKLCAEQASWTYRVEDIDACWPKMSELLGIRAALPNVKRDMNRSKRFNQPWVQKDEGWKEKRARNPTWEELDALDPILSWKCRELARSYGYEA